jgi:hypothetical protein
MACFIEIQIFQLPTDDLIDSREDDMIHGSELSKDFDKYLFISDISDDT